MAEFFQRTAVASQPTHLTGDTDLTANTLHAADLHRKLQKAVAGNSTEEFGVAAFDIHIGASQLLITGGTGAGTHGGRQIVVAQMCRFGRRYESVAERKTKACRPKGVAINRPRARVEAGC